MIIRDLYEKGMIRTWWRDKREGWILVSGLWSPLYIQLRALCSFPLLLRSIGIELGHLISREAPSISRLVGVAMAGIPISIATSLATNLPSAMTRKLASIRTKEDLTSALSHYGEHSSIEGELTDGDNIAIIDDLVTRFDSKNVALWQIEQEVERRALKRVNCRHVVVLFDREQGAKEAAAKLGIQLHALIPFRSVGLEQLRPILSSIEYEVISDYLREPGKFQDERIQRQLANVEAEAHRGHKSA